MTETYLQILDISWSKDGMQLLACSLDGSIAYFKLTEKELGIIVSEQDKVSKNKIF